MLKQSASTEKAEVQAKVEAKMKNVRFSLNLDLDLSLVHLQRTIEVLLCRNGFSAVHEAGNCCYRSFASVASNVFILLRMFSSPASPGHRTGRSGRQDGRLREEPVWHCRS